MTTTPQLTISLQEPHRVILEVQQGGKVWEIDVSPSYSPNRRALLILFAP